MNKLTKAGLVRVSPYKDEPDKLISGSELFAYLREWTEVAPDVTVADVFRFCEPIKSFIGKYSMLDFDAYMAELNKPVDWQKVEHSVVDCVQIHWHAEYFEEYNEVSISADAVAVDSSVLPAEHGRAKDENGETKSRYWALDAMPVNQIGHLPFKIDTKFSIEKLEDGKLIVENWNKKFTLLEILDAFFYEISFFGLPEDREEFLDGLKSKVDEIHNMTEEERNTRLRPLKEENDGNL